VDTAIDGRAGIEALPRGTVTFVLTDIEGSTRRWQQDAEGMKAALSRHDEILVGGIKDHGGVVLKQHGEGDSFFAVFARASDAVAAARDIQRALHSERWRGDWPILVRIAIHTGEAQEETADDYRGPVVNRCARLRAMARGGQTLLSSSVRELVQDRMPKGIALKDLGRHQLRDLDRPEHVYRVIDPELRVVPAPQRSPRRHLFPLAAAAGALVVAIAVFIAVVLRVPPFQSNGPVLSTVAVVNDPTGVAVDTLGNVFIVEGQRIVKLGPNGKLQTLAGSGAVGFAGDGGPALSAKLDLIEGSTSFGATAGIAADGQGNVYFTDGYNQRVRKVALDGTISTVAGSGSGVGGYSGDQGPAVAAQLNSPHGIAVDSFGKLYIADTANNRIRLVNLNDGSITTVVGTGVTGSLGDGGLATQAELNAPQGVALGLDGNLYIADTGNNRIRKVDPSSGVITTIAGTGEPGYSGDHGQANLARLNGPLSVAVSSNGLIYIADTLNNAVRMIAITDEISTVATGALVLPLSVAVDPSSGAVYIADAGNNRVREVHS
jgi:class 3 adenylate cyclase